MILLHKPNQPRFQTEERGHASHDRRGRALPEYFKATFFQGVY
jgi:hypothetical protein